jgi:uncharacterized protein YndB with AHSA1/START domain
MSTLVIIALVVLGLAALVFVVGNFIPRAHSVSVRARYGKSPAEVWKVVTDVESIPTWRPSVLAVRRRHGTAGMPAWVEERKRGDLPLEVTEWTPERRMVVTIVDLEDKLPFGGSWSWTLREVANGTEVTLTENGSVRNVLFRVLAHFVFGYSRHAEQYLRDLGRRVGETVEPKVV